jgi:hypothetical protein
MRRSIPAYTFPENSWKHAYVELTRKFSALEVQAASLLREVATLRSEVSCLHAGKCVSQIKATLGGNATMILT